VSFSDTTDERPTSEPVPDVVGAQRSAAARARSAALSGHTTYSSTSPAWVAITDHLGHVERRAAAEADDAVGAIRFERGRTRHHHRAGRLP
jgi:hypothetical protein